MFNPLPDENHKDYRDYYEWITPEIRNSAKIQSYTATFLVFDSLFKTFSGEGIFDSFKNLFNKNRGK